MRIASMVPSWTETLIEAGADVVARTRFCIHPPSASLISAVGGTKDIDWAKLALCRAELMVLDKDENPLAMAQDSPCPFWASSIGDVHAVPIALRELGEILKNAGEVRVAMNLRALARRWDVTLQRLSAMRRPTAATTPPPALIEWFREPPAGTNFDKIIYLIWKNPYMAASQTTFIGSMLRLMGVHLEVFTTRYPEIDLSLYDPANTLLLFSSEPYPFALKKAELSRLPFASALVDGESLSWFGVRSLRFLESRLGR